MQFKKQMLRETAVFGEGYSLIMLNAIAHIMCFQDVQMMLIYHVVNVTVVLHVYREPGESDENEDAEMEATSHQYSLLCDYLVTFEIFLKMTGELNQARFRAKKEERLKKQSAEAKEVEANMSGTNMVEEAVLPDAVSYCILLNVKLHEIT